MPSALTFGRWDAPKRALLIHGLTSFGLVWARVGPAIADAGYFVIAPDLLNHGLDGSDTKDASIESLSRTLYDSFGKQDFSIVIGHSLGGPVVARFLQLLSENQKRLPDKVILVDPALELKGSLDGVEAHITAEIKTAALDFLEQNPRWSVLDALIKELGGRFLHPEAVRRVFASNVPWEFLDLLPVKQAPQTKLVILAAERHAVFTKEQAERLAQHKWIASKVVPNTGHSIQRDEPETIIHIALRDDFPAHVKDLI